MHQTLHGPSLQRSSWWLELTEASPPCYCQAIISRLKAGAPYTFTLLKIHTIQKSQHILQCINVLLGAKAFCNLSSLRFTMPFVSTLGIIMSGVKLDAWMEMACVVLFPFPLDAALLGWAVQACGVGWQMRLSSWILGSRGPTCVDGQPHHLSCMPGPKLSGPKALPVCLSSLCCEGSPSSCWQQQIHDHHTTKPSAVSCIALQLYFILSIVKVAGCHWLKWDDSW